MSQAFLFLSKNALSFLSINLSLSFFLDWVFSPESPRGRLLGLDTSWWRKDFPRGFSTCLDFLHCPAPLTHPASTALLAALRKTKRTMAQSFLEACHLSKVHVLRKYWTCAKNWCFFTVVLEKTLESSLESKEIKWVNPEGNQAWILNGRTNAEAEAPIFWPPDEKSELIGKNTDAGKYWRQKEKGMTEDEMVGWHYRLNGHGFEQTAGDSRRQGSLPCCSPWGCKETWLSDWTTAANHETNKEEKCVLWEQCQSRSSKHGWDLNWWGEWLNAMVGGKRRWYRPGRKRTRDLQGPGSLVGSGQPL